MKIISLFILTTTFISCNQSEADEINSGLKEVIFHFRPSFFTPSTFTIDVHKKTIKQYLFQDYYRVKEVIDSNSYRDIYKDTLIVYYMKTFPIENLVLNNFLKEVNNSHLDSSENHMNYFIKDGIWFQISKITTNNDTITLTSNLSQRSEPSQLEYSLLDPFFELSLNSIDDNNGILIIQEIQEYFDYEHPED